MQRRAENSEGRVGVALEPAADALRLAATARLLAIRQFRRIGRIERRRPIQMTIWLSADDRRVPLRAFIEAGFGRVRLDLVDYRR